ncbi:MAG: DUF1214 domain-containing protein [Hyphomicrobiaceae bacterium]|nr:DUF1214 domain-containing protein [Hyphomicrobiaceae bacterium]
MYPRFYRDAATRPARRKFAKQILVCLCLAFVTGAPTDRSAMAASPQITVNVDNYARAETDMQIGRMVKLAGGVNRFSHNRGPTPLDQQPVIRMNRDTLYSFAIVDISEGATLVMPDAGKRYMSAMVVNNDGYINKVFHGAGNHKLTLEEFDTPYVVVAVRTLINAADDADIKAANALQDKLKIEAKSAKPWEMPNYNMKSYEATYKPLLELAKGLPNTQETFGSRKQVNPVRFLLGTAFGWGGLPTDEAYYLNVNPKLPVGQYQITAKDVPVDAFWSVSVYNKDGYFQKNALDSYSVNNISGTPNKDGSLTVHLGGCDDKRVNCIPLTEGWNYVVRLYRPRKEVLDGKWKFPKAQPVKK